MMITLAPQPLKASRSTAASRHCDRTSNNCSGSCVIEDYYIHAWIYILKALTKSGWYKDSHIPWRFDVQVPETTKESEKTGAPIKSIPERKGFPFSSKPATTGSQNHGPKLFNKRSNYCWQSIMNAPYRFSYNMDDNIEEKASGRIVRSSLSLYILQRNLINSSRERTSAASPVNPTYRVSLTLNTWDKLRIAKISVKTKAYRLLLENSSLLSAPAYPISYH